MKSYEMKLYNTDEGTLANGTIDQAVNMGSVSASYYTTITNDDDDYGITVKFNSTSNAEITIAAGETRTINDMVIRSLYLSNKSGNDVQYRIVIAGD